MPVYNGTLSFSLHFDCGHTSFEYFTHLLIQKCRYCHISDLLAKATNMLVALLPNSADSSVEALPEL